MAAEDPTRSSLLVEIRNVDLVVLAAPEEVDRLVEAYLRRGVLPAEHEEDLAHLAIASVHRLDVVVSWNFRHMVNTRTQRLLNAVHVEMGYNLIEIRSPLEVSDVE